MAALLALGLLQPQPAASQITQRVNYASANDFKVGLGKVCSDYVALARQSQSDANELLEQQQDVQYAELNGLPYAPELAAQYEKLKFEANQRLALLSTQGRIHQQLAYEDNSSYWSPVTQMIGVGNEFHNHAKIVHKLLQEHAGHAFTPSITNVEFKAGFPVYLTGKSWQSTSIPDAGPGSAGLNYHFAPGTFDGRAGEPDFEPTLRGTATVLSLCSPERFGSLTYKIRVNYLAPGPREITFVTDQQLVFEVQDKWHALAFGSWAEQAETNPAIYEQTWSAIRRLLVEMLSEAPDYAGASSFSRTFMDTRTGEFDSLVRRVRQKLGEQGFPLRRDVVRRLNPTDSKLEIGSFVGITGVCHTNPEYCRSEKLSKSQLRRAKAIMRWPGSLDELASRFAATNSQGSPPPQQPPIPYKRCNQSRGIFAKFTLPNGPRLAIFMQTVTGRDDDSEVYSICAFRIADAEL